MTTEELLIDRYKVIAPDTSGRLHIGDIYYKYNFETSETGMYTYVTNLESPLQGSNAKKEDVETLPHLFQRLEWWEDRQHDETPKFIKSNGIVYKVDKWSKSFQSVHWLGCFVNKTKYIPCEELTPATEADYNAYLQTLTS